MDHHDTKPLIEPILQKAITRRDFMKIAAGAAAAIAAPRSFAQTAYPTKPIRLIVGFPPGGGADAFARLVGTYLEAKLGQAIVIDNRSGANGKIATEYV